MGLNDKERKLFEVLNIKFDEEEQNLFYIVNRPVRSLIIRQEKLGKLKAELLTQLAYLPNFASSHYYRFGNLNRWLSADRFFETVEKHFALLRYVELKADHVDIQNSNIVKRIVSSDLRDISQYLCSFCCFLYYTLCVYFVRGEALAPFKSLSSSYPMQRSTRSSYTKLY